VGEGKEGRQEVEGEECPYNVQIGQAHIPSVARSGLPVTEVEATVGWMSQPPPDTELAVAAASPGRSSSPSSSVLRLRSITSPLVAGGPWL